jgi:hypothetical protein
LIETPFGNQDYILPEDWTKNFWLKFDDNSSDSEVFTTSESEVEKVCKLHLSMFAHSKVKGFMWLWCSHTLPTGTRLRGKDANTACPHCGEVENIRHMTYDCMIAAYIRDIVFMEWWACTTDSKWVRRFTFKCAFFNKDNTTMAVAARTLSDIATFHI